MADANAHNPAEQHPEDAPSEVRPFDEGPDGGSDRGGDNDGNIVHPDDAPSEVEPFDENPDGEGPPPRGRNAGRRNPPRGQNREENAAQRLEDATSEVEPFDEGTVHGVPPPRRPTAGGHRRRRGASRNSARNSPRRDSPARAQSPRTRDFGARAVTPPGSGRGRERGHERRARRDGYARTKPRKPSTKDELLPNRPVAQYNRAVERIRINVYRVPKADKNEPIDDGCYRWFVRGYVREHSNERPKRQIVVEGGPERVVASFDEMTSNSKIHTWVAKKMVEQKGRGRPAPHPSEMREIPHSYDNGICCSIL